MKWFLILFLLVPTTILAEDKCCVFDVKATSVFLEGSCKTIYTEKDSKDCEQSGLFKEGDPDYLPGTIIQAPCYKLSQCRRISKCCITKENKECYYADNVQKVLDCEGILVSHACHEDCSFNIPK